MNADALRTLTGWIPWLGIAGMIIAVITYFDIMRKPAGNELMQKLCDKIHHGAFVFLRREYQIIAVFIVPQVPPEKAKAQGGARRNSAGSLPAIPFEIVAP